MVTETSGPEQIDEIEARLPNAGYRVEDKRA